MLYAGEIIGERYKIIREIGRGGMSIVYQADDLRLGSGKLWAVKEFTYSNSKANTAGREQERKLLREEAEIMKKLDHPTLPRIVDIIEKDETLYIIMDYIEGVSLDKVLIKCGSVDQEAVIEWGKQLSVALDYLHTQNPPIIYRDMKPSNIMLKPDGTVRLIDFGIAREYKDGKVGGASFGTHGYAAPEQEDDNGIVDARSDVYSLGMTLHHLVTGKNPLDPPYEIEPIRRYNSKLSSALEWAIQKCTQLNPQDRFQSCAELYYVLNNLEQFDREYVQKLKRKRNVFILSAAMTVILAIVGVTSMQLQKGTVREQAAMLETQDDCTGRFELIKENEKWFTAEEIAEAYVDLAESLHNNSSIEIYPSGSSDGYRGLSTQLLDSTLSLEYFSSENLQALLEIDEKAYVTVCYDLGYTYWKSYQGSTEEEAILKATPYFEKVILTAGVVNGEDGLGYDAEKVDISKVSYSLAKNYYLVGGLRAIVREGDDNRTEVPNAMKIAMGVDPGDSVSIENVYEVYWEALQEIVTEVSNTDAMSVDARLKILCRVLYLFQENCNEIAGKADPDGNMIVNQTEANAFVQTISKQAESFEKSGAQEKTVEEMDSLLEATQNVIEATFKNSKSK